MWGFLGSIGHGIGQGAQFLGHQASQRMKQMNDDEGRAAQPQGAYHLQAPPLIDWLMKRHQTNQTQGQKPNRNQAQAQTPYSALGAIQLPPFI